MKLSKKVTEYLRNIKGVRILEVEFGWRDKELSINSILEN